MFLPVFVFILIMYYWPMLGIRYAFYDYKPVGAPTLWDSSTFTVCLRPMRSGVHSGTHWN